MRLLLLEAGVTISLSKKRGKQAVRNNKKIQVKPIDLIQQNIFQEKNEMSLDEEQIILQNKVEALHFELSNLKLEKDRILTKAITEIKTEKEKWVEEKKSLEELAKQEGFQAGFAAGEKKALEQYVQKLDEANKVVDIATTDYHKTLDQSEDTIVKIAVYIAEKIIKDQIDNDPNKFKNIVEAAITEIKDQSVVAIYLHPNEYQFVIDQKQELKNALDGDAKIEVYADHKLAKKSCLIKHPFGEIDASVDTQLEQIRSALEELALET